ncbi:MAG: hypothetical protein U0166_10195 [Acidobacteriota bacterium]
MSPTPATAPQRAWRRAALAAVALAFLAVAFFRKGEVMVDDAFITFRYAENLAAGKGLCFNEGERVEGYSNLSYTLLLAVAPVLGVSTLLAAQAIGGAAAVAGLLAMPGLARGLGSSPWRGVGAAIAVGVTATHANWAFRGLETPVFTALLLWGAALASLDLEAGRDPAWKAIALFGIAGITRPEGPAYAVAAAVAIASARGLRSGARFVALSSAWILQIAFRLSYYGDVWPNTYYAKVWAGPERCAAALRYAGSFARGSGALTAAWLLGLGVLALGIKRRAARVPLALVATSLFFVVQSGGDRMADFRFFHATSALLAVAACCAFRGVASVAVAILIPIVAIASPAAAGARRTVASVLVPAAIGDPAARAWIGRRFALLTEVQDVAQREVGTWLAQHLPEARSSPSTTVASFPTRAACRPSTPRGSWTVIARLPGPHARRVDLRYVLSRRPAAIVLALRGVQSASPYDARMASCPELLASYRLAKVVLYTSHAYCVFVATGAPVALPPEGIDLLSELPRAREVEHAAAVHDVVTLPETRVAELMALAPRPGDAVGDAAVATLDAALREIAPATHHGIAFTLAPGSGRGHVKFVLPRLEPGSRLELGLLRRGPGAAELRVRLEGSGGVAIDRTLAAGARGEVVRLEEEIPRLVDGAELELTVAPSPVADGSVEVDVVEPLLSSPRGAAQKPSSAPTMLTP